MQRNFECNVPLHHIVLGVMTKLEIDDENVAFDLEVDKGNLSVWANYVGAMSLSSEEVSYTFYVLNYFFALYCQLGKLFTTFY